MRCPYCDTYLEPNAQFCGRCGAKIPVQQRTIEDEVTVRANVEDYVDDMRFRQPAESTMPEQEDKNSKTLGIIAITLAVVMVVAVIVGSVIIGGKHLFDRQDAVTAGDAYNAFMQSEIAPQKGVFTSEAANDNPNGVLAVKTLQLDKDNENELVIAYCETSGSKITTNIACYDYNEKQYVQGDVTSAVELTGVVSPISENNYINDRQNHTSNEKVMYTFTCNKQTFIALEHIAYKGTQCSYECHIYTVDGGVLKEHSNWFEQTNGSSDYAQACQKVKTFFANFGITRNNYIVPSDYNKGRYYEINFESDIELMYRYCYYYTEDGGSRKDIYGFDNFESAAELK